MNQFGQRPRLEDFARRKATPVLMDPNHLVEESLIDDRPLPLVVTPRLAGLDLAKWAAINRDTIEGHLNRYGGILFRGFDLDTAEKFRNFIAAATAEPLPYTERSSPRTHLKNNIYTSTEHPKDEEIFLHNEQSYNLQFPLRIGFYCQQAAESGGETPIADCRRVYQRLRPETIERFATGYLYVRYFTPGLGVSWKDAFQTADRDAVAVYCESNRIGHEWLPDGTLRTEQVRPVAGRHPRTGELVWCNHLTFFNLSTLRPETQELLLREFQGRLPNNTYYSDGTTIEPDVLDELRAAYVAERTEFTWHNGDALLLDNMMIAHARKPFVGARTVLVGMSDLCHWDQRGMW